MSIINPTPGELTDRLTILELKCKEDDREEYKEEMAEIRVRLEDHQVEDWKTRYHILHSLNSLIWKMECDVRVDTGAIRLANLAKRIAKANDERRKVIQAIDSKTGVRSEGRYYDTEGRYYDTAHEKPRS